MANFDFVRRLFNSERSEDLVKSIDPINGKVDLYSFEKEAENRQVGDLTNAMGGSVSYGFNGNDNSLDVRSLINTYREMEIQAAVGDAVNEIVNEAIIKTDGDIVSISLEDTELSEDTKEQIVEAFKDLLNVMSFNQLGDEYFKQWYVDGRLYSQNIYNNKDSTDGIIGFNVLSPFNLERIKTDDGKQYYVYKIDKNRRMGSLSYNDRYLGFIIPDDHINFTPSGKKDPTGSVYVSYLHSAIIPYNRLRELEDGAVIYTLTRSVERRHFKVKTGKLPPTKADSHVKQMMDKFKNRVVYDRASGAVIQKKDVMTIAEDFWSASSDDGRGIDIDSVPAGSQLTDLVVNMEYYKRNLLNSLKVPFGRFDVAGSQISFGDNAKEINREELRFAKFINGLRDKFARGLFIPMLKKHLLLKGLVDLDDFYEIENNIKFDWSKDQFYEETAKQERLRSKMEILGLINPYIGLKGYYSKKYVYDNVLNMSEEEIKQMINEIKMEEKLGEITFGDENTEIIEPDINSDGSIPMDTGETVPEESTTETPVEEPAPTPSDFGGTPAEDK